MLMTRPTLRCVQQFILQKLNVFQDQYYFKLAFWTILLAFLVQTFSEDCWIDVQCMQNSIRSQKVDSNKLNWDLPSFKTLVILMNHSWILLLLIQFAFAEMIDRTAAISQSPSKLIEGRHFPLNLLHLIIS